MIKNGVLVQPPIYLLTLGAGAGCCFLDGATVVGGGGLGERKMEVAVEETLSISSDSPLGSSMVSLGCVYRGLRTVLPDGKI